MQQAVYRGKDENALIKTRSFCHMRYVLSITNNVIYRQNKYCTNLKPIEKYTNFKVLKKLLVKSQNKQKSVCCKSYKQSQTMLLKSYAFKGFDTLSK